MERVYTKDQARTCTVDATIIHQRIIRIERHNTSSWVVTESCQEIVVGTSVTGLLGDEIG